jgi:photosystem II stability/assembly factor-like uncharacterized protein
MSTQYDNLNLTWTKVGGPAAGTISALVIGKTADGQSVAFIGTKIGLYRAAIDGTAAPAWQRLTGAPLGVMALAVSPDFAADRTVFAGADSGIYISRDAGDTWRAAQVPISRSMVLTLACSPNFAADGILVAGTLEDGIWYSHDRGENWHSRSFGLLDATVFALAISPDFAQDETLFAGTDTAIYYSYNGARAWKQLDFPDVAAPVLSLAVSPNYAASGAADGTLYAGTEQNGLYRSTDRGESWHKVDLPAVNVNVLLALAATQAREACVLATTETGIYQTTDQGATWACLVELADVLCLAAPVETCHGASLQAMAGASMPVMAGASILVMAGLVDQGAWATTDLADWQPVPVPSIRSVVGLALSPDFEADPMAFMYGPQEGIWRTADGGVTWECINDPLPSLDIQSLVVSPNFAAPGAAGGAADRALVATSPDGVFVSTDAGDHWEVVTQEAAGQPAFSPGGQRLAVAFPGVGIRLSGDLGRSWQAVEGPWDAGGQVAALAVGDDAHMRVALIEGVEDVLSIWQGAPDQYTRVLVQPTGQNPVVSFWLPQPDDPAAPWYASLGSRVWRIAAGAIVAESGIAAGASQREDILSLSGTRPQVGGTLFACTRQHLYRSSDGQLWEQVADFSPETAIACALSPSQTAIKSAYVLFLGGATYTAKLDFSSQA